MLSKDQVFSIVDAVQPGDPETARISLRAIGEDLRASCPEHTIETLIGVCVNRAEGLVKKFREGLGGDFDPDLGAKLLDNHVSPRDIQRARRQMTLSEQVFRDLIDRPKDSPTYQTALLSFAIAWKLMGVPTRDALELTTITARSAAPRRTV